MQRLDLKGKRFSRLLVIDYSHTKISAFWKCICDCGNETISRGDQLVKGRKVSCGCYAKTRAIKHGMSGKKISEYSTWKSIKGRCYNKNNADFYNYGERGILMCDEWKNDFMAFLNDMGKKPSRFHSIDRIDNNKGYSKENCRWANPLEQCNNKTNHHYITYNGETKNIAEWTRCLGFNKSTIDDRIKLGWSKELIFTTPIKQGQVVVIESVEEAINLINQN